MSSIAFVYASLFVIYFLLLDKASTNTSASSETPDTLYDFHSNPTLRFFKEMIFTYFA